MVAPPGSTLLFGEALIHASGQIRSDNRRCIIIGGARDPDCRVTADLRALPRRSCIDHGRWAGYPPPYFQAWNGQEPSPEFIEQVPAFLRPLISASDKWSWRQQRRKLSDAAAPYPRAAL